MITPDDERVLVLAPLGRDGILVCKLLTEAGIGCTACADIETLAAELGRGVGVILLTSEALSPPVTRLLSQTIAGQPTWSELPIVLMLVAGQPLSEAEIRHSLGMTTNLTLLARPVPTATLVTLCQSLLQARRRQYQVRDLLVHLSEVNDSLERRVRKRTQQVRTLAAQLSLAEHAERKRIAQILHDHVQQMLYGVQFRLHLIGQGLAANIHDFDDTPLAETRQLAEDAVQAVRTLAVELSPPILENEGLSETLSWLANHVQEQYGLTVSLNTEGDLSVVDQHLSIVIYQMVRELLFNVVKHARVDAAEVTLQQKQGQLFVTVADQGVGYEVTVEAVRSKTGFGLANMQERISLFNGQMTVHSGPDQGTCVSLTLPLKLESGEASPAED